jgi:hypothetical protein
MSYYNGADGPNPTHEYFAVCVSSFHEWQNVSFDIVVDRRTGKSAVENLRAS